MGCRYYPVVALSAKFFSLDGVSKYGVIVVERKPLRNGRMDGTSCGAGGTTRTALLAGLSVDFHPSSLVLIKTT